MAVRRGLLLVLAAAELHPALGTHPRRSAGCGGGLPSGIVPGQSNSQGGSFNNVQRAWQVFVPSSYNPSQPVPLVLSLHGWGGSGVEDEHDGGMGLMAEQNGFIGLFPNGMADNDNWGGPWGSWNVVGSTDSPGSDGPTCAMWANSPGYCYESCQTIGRCTDDPQCDWTTCVDDLTPSGVGTQDQGGFLPQLLNWAEANFCIDVTREYATGQSNGGMATYQAGVTMAPRLAAIAPVAGSFHNGFDQAPSAPLPVMDIHGNEDTTVPSNVTMAYNGWYYVLTEQILAGFAQVNGCQDIGTARVDFPTSLDGVAGLSCVTHGSNCQSAPAVACAYQGSHTYFANDAMYNGQLVWGFLSQYTNPTHLGFGRTNGTKVVGRTKSAAVAKDPAPAPKRPQAAAVERPRASLAPPQPAHYGDPAAGCLADEDVVRLTDGKSPGHICAPRVPVVKSQESGEAPQCRVGGRFPRSGNGCPRDAPLPPGSEAWPICVASVGPDRQAPSFNCLLVCGPCRDDPLHRPNTCSDRAHESCPQGARCVLGHLMAVDQGVCAYVPNSATHMAPNETIVAMV